jgi:hypothetical protein
MARFRRYLDHDGGIATMINLDAVLIAKFRTQDITTVILQGGIEITLRVTLDAFLKHLRGDQT